MNPGVHLNHAFLKTDLKRYSKQFYTKPYFIVYINICWLRKVESENYQNVKPLSSVATHHHSLAAEKKKKDII